MFYRCTGISESIVKDSVTYSIIQTLLTLFHIKTNYGTRNHCRAEIFDSCHDSVIQKMIIIVFYVFQQDKIH